LLERLQIYARAIDEYRRSAIQKLERLRESQQLPENDSNERMKTREFSEHLSSFPQLYSPEFVDGVSIFGLDSPPPTAALASPRRKGESADRHELESL
jgi:hypothetical protein